MSQLGNVLSKKMQLKHITDQGLWAKPQLQNNLVIPVFQKKIAILMLFESNYIFVEPSKKLTCYNLKAIWKN